MALLELSGHNNLEIQTLEDNADIIHQSLTHREIKREHRYTVEAIEQAKKYGDDFTEVLLMNLVHQAKVFSTFSDFSEKDLPTTLRQALDRKKSNCFLLPLVLACRLKYAEENNDLPKDRYHSILTTISYNHDTLIHGVLVVHDNATKKFHTIHANTIMSPLVVGDIWNEEIPGTAILNKIIPYPTFMIFDKYHQSGTIGHFVSPESVLLFNKGLHLLEIGDMKGLNILSKLSDQISPNHPLVTHSSYLFKKR
jgi:hypothetical protein